jgi:hypothetical protein
MSQSLEESMGKMHVERGQLKNVIFKCIDSTHPVNQKSQANSQVKLSKKVQVFQ